MALIFSSLVVKRSFIGVYMKSSIYGDILPPPKEAGASRAMRLSALAFHEPAPCVPRLYAFIFRLAAACAKLLF
jgi:hypothetical protein